VNSFPRWVLFLIVGRVPGLGPRRRALLSLRTVSLLLRRKFAGASHEDFLWRLQGLWRSACARRDAPSKRFETKLLRLVRPNLAAALELVATDRIDAVLATAAAEDYAMSLGRRLGFRHVLATASNRSHGEPANSGAQKREQVLALLDECGWRRRPILLFTDHVDDLPLMHDSTTVYWCGPLRELERAATAAANARFVFCGDLDGGEIARRLSEACCGSRRNDRADGRGRHSSSVIPAKAGTQAVTAPPISR
jgi:phosphoserine phosphatase